MPAGWIAAATVVGAGISAYGATSAAQTQADAAKNGQNIQQQMFNQTVANEQPFLQSGQGAQGQLNYLLGIGTPGSTGTQATPGYAGRGGSSAGTAASPATASSSPAGGYGSLLTPFTADNFKQMSPAYQFQMQQGQQGVLNSESASQGALSGAALKDLTGYNQNLANTSYGTAFNQYQTQQGNIYARLAGIANQGQAAASNQATGASNFGSSIGQQAQNVGTALGAGQVGAANAISNGVSNLGSIYAAYGGGSAQSQVGSNMGSFANTGYTSSADPTASFGAGQGVVP